MATRHRLFCKPLLRFDTMPCRHTPLLVHFLIISMNLIISIMYVYIYVDHYIVCVNRTMHEAPGR